MRVDGGVVRGVADGRELWDTSGCQSEGQGEREAEGEGREAHPHSLPVSPAVFHTADRSTRNQIAFGQTIATTMPAPSTGACQSIVASSVFPSTRTRLRFPSRRL